MIPVEYYNIVYFLLLIFITMALSFRILQGNNKNFNSASINKYWCFLFLLFTILFIGLRDPYASFKYFGDTAVYTRFFNEIQYINAIEKKDAGFYVFMKICSYFMDIRMFYLICAFLYIIPVYYTFKKWFSNLALYALVMTVVSLSFWAFGINGVRNGLAVSFFVFSLGFVGKNRWLMILFMFLSVVFHKSLLLPVFFFWISYFVRLQINKLIIIWLGCVILSAIIGVKIEEFTQPILGSFDDSRLHFYSEVLGSELEDFVAKGFRYDFVLYSSLPIFLGWYYINIKKYSDYFYERLLNIYVLSNSVWILFFMFVPFTNRYAYLSWCIMPVIMIYPLLKQKIMENQNIFISHLISGTLLLTIIILLL